ncbi:SpoIID/LytB domain-containing protein [Leptospira sp. 96542]|nr:SpoIID/LytB domain-containing protein [Leptospira sp. 96542]
MNFRKSILFLSIALFGQIGCSSILVSKWAPDDDRTEISMVRVLLGYGTEEESFKTDGELVVLDANDLVIKRTYDFLSINASVVKAPIKLQSVSNFIEYKGTSYRGTIHIKPVNGKVYLLNILPVEEYLMAVVPSEVSASWPREALRAQAICARTYVLREILNRKNQVYDVDTSTNTQVYKGKNKEHKNTTEAVFDTAGLILIYKGQPIQSFFHSNSGGITEDPANVWGNSIAYLKSVPSDYDKDGEQYSWEEKYKPSLINTALQPLGVGEIQDIIVVSRFPSSRVNELEIIGNITTKKIKATEFRKLIGVTKLRSTRFGIRREDNGEFYVKGLGSGHGVGMSQWGSFAMAKNQFSYRDILQHYYKGVEFARMSTN